jgi:hypothetical protein
MKWKPVINEQNLKLEIEKKIDQIYISIKKNLDKVSNVKLYEGKIGIYLFLVYYDLFKEQRKLSINDTLNDLIKEINSLESKNIYSVIPYPELGWFMYHLLENKIINFDVRPYFVDIEQELLDVYKYFIETGRYDCLNGGIIFGLFFLNYSNYYNTSDDFLLTILGLIKKKALSKDNMIRWKSKINFETAEEGYNIGVAHGIPGILLFLLKIQKRMGENELYQIIEGTCNFIISQIQDINIYNSYFSGVASDYTNYNRNTRLGWCYGDLSVGYALYMASKSNKKLNPVKNIALRILSHTTSRKDLQSAGVNDASICHGSAGIALIYNRLYNLSSLDIFKFSAQNWYSKTLEMSIFDNNQYAGFYNKVINNENTNELDKNLSFLNGISGIGLSLISSITTIEPKWDDCLLL